MKEKKDFGFNLDNISVKEYILCDNFFSKFRGLMFRGKNFNIPLLFVFDKPGRYPIHSFFCRKFLAIWMFDDKIIEKKIIEPWKIYICPKEKFNFLVEIPQNP